MFCIQPLSEPLLVLKCILTFQDAIVCMCFLINLILKFLGYYFFSFECLGDFQLFILVRIFQLQISKASEVEIEEQLEVEQLKKHSSTFYEWLGIRRKGSYAPPPILSLLLCAHLSPCSSRPVPCPHNYFFYLSSPELFIQQVFIKLLQYTRTARHCCRPRRYSSEQDKIPALGSLRGK